MGNGGEEGEEPHEPRGRRSSSSLRRALTGEPSLLRAVERANGVREGEAELLVAEDSKEEARAARERSSERRQ